MISPPTDRLYKFLAVGGLGLVSLGVTVGLTKHGQVRAEMIEAEAAISKAEYSYNRYAHKVNDLNRDYRVVIDEGRSPADKELSKTRIRDGMPAADALQKEAEDSSIAARKQSRIMVDASEQRNLWFLISAICVIAGSVAAIIGFKEWFLKARNER